MRHRIDRWLQDHGAFCVCGRSRFRFGRGQEVNVMTDVTFSPLAPEKRLRPSSLRGETCVGAKASESPAGCDPACSWNRRMRDPLVRWCDRESP